MLKIKKAEAAERERITDLLFRVNDSLSRVGWHGIEEARVQESLEEGRLHLLLNHAEILGAISFTSRVKETLFPGTSSRAYFDFLDGLGFEAPLTLIEFLFVDPSLRGKGLGKLMLKDVLAAKKDTHIVARIESKNVTACEFFSRNGFLFHHEEKGIAWYVRPFVKEGLCQNPRW